MNISTSLSVFLLFWVIVYFKLNKLNKSDDINNEPKQ